MKLIKHALYVTYRAGMRRKEMKLIKHILHIMVVMVMVSAMVQAGAQELPPVKIGALGAFSGEVAGTGELFKKGIELRLDEAGWKVAGRKIELIFEDSGSTPDMSMDKARKMVEQDGVHVILGPMLPHIMAAVRAYLEPKKMFNLSYFQIPLKLAEYENMIAVGATLEAASPHLGWHAYEVLGYRTMVTMTPDFESGHLYMGSVEEGFKSKGGAVLKKLPIPFGTMDFGPYLATIAANKPDCVVPFFMEPVVALRFFQQYRAFGLEKTPVISAGADSIEPILSDLGDYALGIYAGIPYSETLDTDVNKRFVSAFRSKYGERPIGYNVAGWISVSVFLEALKATGGDTTYEKLLPALLAVKLDTPRGSQEFDSRGIGIIDHYIGKVVKVEEGSYAWKVIKKYSGIGAPSK
jgi:branched-chain amino acid transport system substrate-binding protein